MVRWQHRFGDKIVVIHDDAHNLDGSSCLPSTVRTSEPEHLNVKIYDAQNTSNNLYNAHVGTYNESGQICMFYWESVSGVCNTKCLDKSDFTLSAVESWLMDQVRQSQSEGADVIQVIGVAALVGVIIAAWAVPVVPPTPP
jgi:hypothetical protein